ncbi:MAG TPA: hypothetical protein VEG38_15445 [Acidimicrobiia bacterium]|nr:hypothetical protein [Acidimicrobiia bacterium]
MTVPQRFAISFTRANRAVMRGMLIPPQRAYVDVTDDTIDVRMGWAFSARIPRRLVARAGPGQRPMIPFTAGAHGWRGRWLINGSSNGIVEIELSEPGRASTLGFPIRLKTLSVSLEDPERFLASVT